MVTNHDRKSFESCRKSFKICSDDWHRWRFWSASRHFGTHFAESFRMSKSSWMVDPTRSREMPICSAIDLAETRRSSKISSWIWSIIRGGHCFGSSRTRRITDGKITTFKLGHPVFDGGIWLCMFPLCFYQNGVNFLRRLALQGGNLTALISMLLKSRASPDMLPFSLCNKKRLAIRHMNRPLFPKTLSIPSHDIGK